MIILTNNYYYLSMKEWIRVKYVCIWVYSICFSPRSLFKYHSIELYINDWIRYRDKLIYTSFQLVPALILKASSFSFETSWKDVNLVTNEGNLNQNILNSSRFISHIWLGQAHLYETDELSTPLIIPKHRFISFIYIP